MWLLRWKYQMKVIVAHLCPTLCSLMDCSLPCQALLFMVFSRHEYWSRSPFCSPGNIPNPEMEPRSPAWQADSLPSEPSGNIR